MAAVKHFRKFRIFHIGRKNVNLNGLEGILVTRSTTVSATYHYRNVVFMKILLFIRSALLLHAHPLNTRGESVRSNIYYTQMI